MQPSITIRIAYDSRRYCNGWFYDITEEGGHLIGGDILDATEESEEGAQEALDEVLAFAREEYPRALVVVDHPEYGMEVDLADECEEEEATDPIRIRVWYDRPDDDDHGWSYEVTEDESYTFDWGWLQSTEYSHAGLQAALAEVRTLAEASWPEAVIWVDDPQFALTIRLAEEEEEDEE